MSDGIIEKFQKLSKKHGHIALEWFDDDSGALYIYDYDYIGERQIVEKKELFDFLGVEEFVKKFNEQG